MYFLGADHHCVVEMRTTWSIGAASVVEWWDGAVIQGIRPPALRLL